MSDNQLASETAALLLSAQLAPPWVNMCLKKGVILKPGTDLLPWDLFAMKENKLFPTEETCFPDLKNTNVVS